MSGADWEISVDGKVRSHRDVKEAALDAGRYLKIKNPNASVSVRNYVTGEVLELGDPMAWANRG